MAKNFLLLISLFSILAFSFKDKLKSESDTEFPNRIVEQAANNESLRGSYKLGSNDMVDRLFEEALENSPELQRMNNQIKELKQLQSDQLKEWEKFQGIQQSYIASVSQHLGTIRDGGLRTKAEELFLEISKTQKEALIIKTKKFNSLNQLSSELEDHHTLLKIMITNPIMEGYRKENIPSNQKLEELVKKYENLIGEFTKLIETES